LDQFTKERFGRRFRQIQTRGTFERIIFSRADDEVGSVIGKLLELTENSEGNRSVTSQ
jgi:hypothetical protein